MRLAIKTLFFAFLCIALIVPVPPGIALITDSDEDDFVVPKEIQEYIAVRQSRNLETKIYEIHREQTDVFEPMHEDGCCGNTTLEEAIGFKRSISLDSCPSCVSVLRIYDIPCNGFPHSSPYSLPIGLKTE